MDTSYNLEKNSFPRHKTALLGKPSLPKNALFTIFVFSNIFVFLLSFLFLLSFSRPPRGHVKTKKVLHTCSLEPIPVWRREWDSNPRGRDAQRLSCQSTNIQMGSRGRRFNHSAIPAQQPTKTKRVLNHSSA